jgi:tRNA A37 threonylcarbamoyladenosine biosynthesis protein TsaE
MEKIGYLEHGIARLLISWLEKHPWNAELFDLTSVFLENILPLNGPLERQSFPEDAAKARVIRESYSEKLRPFIDVGSINPAISIIAQRFNLSSAETKLVDFFFLYCRFLFLEHYFDKLPEWDQIERLSYWCGLDGNTILNTMCPLGKLVLSGIGINDGHALRMLRHGITFGLAEPVLSYIDSEANHPLSSFLLEVDEKEILPLSAFDLPEVTMAAAKSTLIMAGGKPIILLYGKPGTGKSEFSRSLCRSVGLQPCYLKHDRATGKRSYPDLLLAARLVDPNNEVLIVDEADEILNLDPGLFSAPVEGIKKSMINDFMDDSTARMIFISNATSRIPDSILRRFSFHIAFEDLGPLQRLRVWNALCPSEHPFSASERSSLASRFRANPARIRQIIDVCGSIDPASSEDNNSFAVAQDMLARSDELMYGIARHKSEQNLQYNARFLNLGVPVDDLLQSLVTWKARFPGTERGLNLLFYGMPGSGKTAFAHHLAEYLGLNPIVKRGSDLMSPYVGMTEKAIHEAFHEAEGSVLIIDEADSLLSERQTAAHRWERSQTNEILTSMESFKGLFIASTNFKTALDSASFRRFTFKIEFRSTLPEQRHELVSTYFPELKWSKEDQVKLESLADITPGDIAVVSSRLELVSTLSPSIVLNELQVELECRGHRSSRIGFVSD